MLYQDLIKLVGCYLSYDELMKDNPELDLSQKDYYSVLEGQTMQKQKRLLKARYIDAFNDDWNNRKEKAMTLLRYAKETSNNNNNGTK